jgi:hypothetical protein
MSCSKSKTRRRVPSKPFKRPWKIRVFGRFPMEIVFASEERF